LAIDAEREDHRRIIIGHGCARCSPLGPLGLAIGH
jgi:hypothetical protein